MDLYYFVFAVNHIPFSPDPIKLINCCENPESSANDPTETKYSAEEAISFIWPASTLPPIPRHRILIPLCFSAPDELETESVDFPAIITTRRRAETLAPAAAPPLTAPPPAAAPPPPPALANKDDWHVDSAAPAAQDPPTSLSYRFKKKNQQFSLYAAITKRFKLRDFQFQFDHLFVKVYL